ncbi:hypothetical protein CHARACLAT_012037 [Characodon lateralis]|uniref:Uncharacterized protein n=1 Tax=Characodon lateralis TaxID=208331 RepID=A0ABU7E355_9TELE|nr:hypothetical protein [Characodon lateralis]
MEREAKLKLVLLHGAALSVQTGRETVSQPVYLNPSPLHHYKPSHLHLIIIFLQFLLDFCTSEDFFFHTQETKTTNCFFFVKLEMHGLIFPRSSFNLTKEGKNKKSPFLFLTLFSNREMS